MTRRLTVVALLTFVGLVALTVRVPMTLTATREGAPRSIAEADALQQTLEEAGRGQWPVNLGLERERWVWQRGMVDAVFETPPIGTNDEVVARLRLAVWTVDSSRLAVRLVVLTFLAAVVVAWVLIWAVFERRGLELGIEIDHTAWELAIALSVVAVLLVTWVPSRRPAGGSPLNSGTYSLQLVCAGALAMAVGAILVRANRRPNSGG